MQIDEIDSADLRQLERALGDTKLWNAAQARALNRVVTSLTKTVAQDVREEYFVKASAVKKSLWIKRARTNNPEATLLVRGRRIPLSKFSARQTKKGVSVNVKRSTGRQMLNGAFLATVGNGHKGVFWRGRPGDGRRRRKPVPRRVGPDSSQLPIDELMGPAIGQMAKGREVLDRMLNEARRRYPAQLEREARFRLKRALGYV